MLNNLSEFLAHWAITALALWVASAIFRGISFSNKQSLFISALLLGFANAIVRPVLVILTLPITLLTFGFFLLVINALVIMLVAAIVPGFRISGFWTAFFASIFIAIFSFFIGLLIFQSGGHPIMMPTRGGIMI
ncbi:MAG: phage holin family protein [Sulfurimicrobium sp.]|jgi:putative membrane protein|nr:phage holin family protein [Sulfurimicrobium sp.]MDP2963487.1 phage holin family protein [Sulfurimicrobium sp.]MDP3685963.1 phage holin family protein [Sulfurimicrobium sp.]MDZ7655723.1 phage holin family protein [Sulfurimicrobium sp.]